jgi:hypothetical protein
MAMVPAPEHRRSAVSNGYSYQELTEDDSIRLLLVQPALSKVAAICCRLVHTTLSECESDIYEHYVALSYVWGDTTRHESVWIDDSEVTVTASLHSALRDLRDKTRVLRLWVDALCINQSSDEEKIDQVSLMKYIYASAKITVIYLGPLDLDTEQLLSVSNGLTGSSGNLHHLQIAKTILNLPWFRRVWIFQEFVLSQEPWVQFGHYRWIWSSVYYLLESQEKYLAPDLKNKTISQVDSNPLISESAIYQSIYRMDIARQKYQDPCESYPFTLMTVLPTRRGFECTDLRDMIFAHLSFTSEGLNGNLNADYTMTCAEVYEEFAWWTMKHEFDSKILSHIDPLHSPTRPEGLASWAPDWSSPKATIPLHAEGPVAKALAKYHKDGLFQSHHTWVDERKKSRTLILLGYVVDSVLACSAPLSGMASLHELCSDISSLLHDFYRRFDYHEEAENKRELHEFIYRAWKDFLQNDEILPQQHTRENDDILKFFLEGFEYEERNKDYTNYHESHQVVDHLMWYFSPGFNKAFFDGRALARLASGRLAIVPVGVQENDIVFRLPGFSKFGPGIAINAFGLTEELCPYLVTRPLKVSQNERAPVTKESIGHALDVLDHSVVGRYCQGLKPDTDDFLRCTLIGECVVDNPNMQTQFLPTSPKNSRVDAFKLTIMAVSQIKECSSLSILA